MATGNLAGAPAVGKVKALYDYEAADEEELTFRKGDVIEVLDNSQEDWWVGRVGDRTGDFPTNYVQEAAPDDEVPEEGREPEPEAQPDNQQQHRASDRISPERTPPTDSDGGADALPPGWATAVDPDSGDTYYFNSETGDVSWDPPNPDGTAVEENLPAEAQAETETEDAQPVDEEDQIVNVRLDAAPPQSGPQPPAGDRAGVGPSPRFSGRKYRDPGEAGGDGNGEWVDIDEEEERLREYEAELERQQQEQRQAIEQQRERIRRQREQRQEEIARQREQEAEAAATGMAAEGGSADEHEYADSRSSRNPSQQEVRQTDSSTGRDSRNQLPAAVGSDRQKLPFDEQSVHLIARLVDERLMSEMQKRDHVLVDMKRAMDQIANQMQEQSRRWEEFRSAIPAQHAPTIRGQEQRGGSSRIPRAPGERGGGARRRSGAPAPAGGASDRGKQNDLKLPKVSRSADGVLERNTRGQRVAGGDDTVAQYSAGAAGTGARSAEGAVVPPPSMIPRPKQRDSAHLPQIAPGGSYQQQRQQQQQQQQQQQNQLQKQQQHQERDAPAHSVDHTGIRYPPCRSVCYPPSDADALAVDPAPPDSTLQLQYVHGYSGEYSKHAMSRASNVCWLRTGELVFPAASVVVFLDPQSNMQRFYFGHDDEVMCIATHPHNNVVASGQAGRSATIAVCDATRVRQTRSESPTLIHEFSLGTNSRGVACVDFSPDGTLLLAVGNDDGHCVHVLDWRAGRSLHCMRTSNQEIYNMRFNPFLFAAPEDDGPSACYTLISCGLRQIKFWTLSHVEEIVDRSNQRGAGGGVYRARAPNARGRRKSGLGAVPGVSTTTKWMMEGSLGSFGKHADMQDVTCFVCVRDSPGDVALGIPPTGRIFSGTQSGSLYVWQQLEETGAEQITDAGVSAPAAGANGGGAGGPTSPRNPVRWQSRGRLISVVTEAHDGEILDIAYTGPTGNRLATCGLDGVVSVWRVVRVTDRKRSPLSLIRSTHITTSAPALGMPRALAWGPDCTSIVLGTKGNALCLLTPHHPPQTEQTADSMSLEQGQQSREHADGADGQQRSEDDHGGAGQESRSSSRASSSASSEVGMRVLLRGHLGKPRAVAEHPTRPLFVTVGNDRTVRLWDASRRKLLSMTRLADRACAVTFHPSGECIAVGTETGELWVLTCAALQGDRRPPTQQEEHDRGQEQEQGRPHDERGEDDRGQYGAENGHDDRYEEYEHEQENRSAYGGSDGRPHGGSEDMGSAGDAASASGAPAPSPGGAQSWELLVRRSVLRQPSAAGPASSSSVSPASGRKAGGGKPNKSPARPVAFGSHVSVDASSAEGAGVAAAAGAAAAAVGGGGGGEDAQRKKHNAKLAEVQVLRYSPDGNVMAAACRDNLIYLFNVTTGYRRLGVCRGHSTYVTTLDFSLNSAFMQSVDAGHELLYWDVTKAKQTSNGAVLRDLQWHSYTAQHGWVAQGLWVDANGQALSATAGPASATVVARSHDEQVFLVGHDPKAVRLYSCPAPPGAESKGFRVHVSSISACTFSSNDSHAYTCGANDSIVAQWQHTVDPTDIGV